VAIQSRVAKMPPECQEVLRLAAVLGREFEFATLFAAADPSPGSGQGWSEEDLIEALESATRAQLVEEVRAGRDVTFGFTHGLIPATLAEGVSTLRRRRLHRRAAAAIERLHPQDFEALAYHYAEAGDEERALVYHRQAGERASAAYANVEAEGHYRAALELAETEAERADLRGELGRALVRQSRYEEAIEAWQEGIALYQGLGDLDGVARLYARTARAAWHGGDPPRGLRLCREGMAAVGGAPESPDLVDLLHETARACHFNGLPDEAAPLCRGALEMAERLGAVRVQTEALTTLGVLAGRPHEEAVSTLTRAVELAESAGLLHQAARAHNNLGVVLIDPGVAREHFSRAAELDRQRGELASELFSRVNAAGESLALGDLADVEEILPSLRQLLDAIEKPGMAALNLRGLEVALLRYRGELAAAIEALQALRTEARKAGDLQALSWVSQTLLEVMVLEGVGEEEEIEAVLQETLDLGRRGMGTVILAWILQSVQRARQGELKAARHLLAEAHEKAAAQGKLVQWEPFLSWAEAHVTLAEGCYPEALAAFEATVETLDQANQRWYRARVLIDWAEAHLARAEPGDRERAGDILREAEAEFQAMGAPLYVQRIKAHLQALAAGSSAP
jgi:tetratricopeptide (TPR) repeat protein